MDKLDLIVGILNDVKESQERTNERLEKLEVNSVKNTVDLEHHIKRTDLAEENIELLRSEMKPVTEHIALLKLIIKVGSVIGGVLVFAKTMELF